MTFRILKTVSFVASVGIGLAMAYLSVSGVRFWSETFVVRTVSASAPARTLETPEDPILITFSEALGEDVFPQDLSVTPDARYRPEWRDDGRTLALLPETAWSAGTTYHIRSSGYRAGLRREVAPVSFDTVVPGYPSVVSISPEDGAKDVLLDIEDPITVRFDRSVSAFYVDFAISPAAAVTYENDPDKTEFRMLPREPLAAETRFEMTVRIKWRHEPDDAYRELRRISFTTPPKRPATWSQDVFERVEQVRRYATSPQPSGKAIDIDLSSQVMTIFENGRLLDAYPVSSGKPGMDTPKGEYAIRNKAPRPWSSAYGLYMPYWMALVPDGKFGIHELPEWPGGYKEGAAHLGRPVSHGCVRLGVGPAGRVYEWADIGTPVRVH